jgi:hypothetical protein
MIAQASSWSWPFGRAGGKGGVSISKALDKLIPVWGVGGFANPRFEGTKIVNCYFGHVGKEQLEVLDNVIFVVQEGATNKTGVVTACGQYALNWSIMGATYHNSKKVHLTKLQSCCVSKVCHRTYNKCAHF